MPSTTQWFSTAAARCGDRLAHRGAASRCLPVAFSVRARREYSAAGARNAAPCRWR